MGDGALTAGQSAKRQPLLRLLSDERLAKHACEGSTQAFAAIYERHHQAVYRYARSILHSDHDARDALQSTMLKAMQALDGERREIALRPWLLRIAHNEAISMLRRRPGDASIDGANEVAAAEGDPEARERLRALIADLDQLSLRQRSALVMRELNGLEFEEIGFALETSPEAAKQAVYEARVALHELEEGREMTCDDVQRKISAEDRRLLRGRRMRGHLRSCESCRAFAASTRTRRSQLASIAPPLPLPIALGILDSLTGGGTGGGIGALAGGGGAAGLGGSTVAKFGVAGVLAIGIGTAALESGQPGTATGASPGTEAERPGSGQTTGSFSPGDPRRGSDREARGAQAADRRKRPGSSGDGAAHNEAPAGGVLGVGTAGDGGAGGAPPSHQPPGSAQTVPGQVGPPSSVGGGASEGGELPEGSNESGGDDPADSGGGSPNGNGPAGLPPGHGGVPPGQGGVPPGLGAPPPGHGGPVPGQEDKENEED